MVKIIFTVTAENGFGDARVDSEVDDSTTSLRDLQDAFARLKQLNVEQSARPVIAEICRNKGFDSKPWLD